MGLHFFRRSHQTEGPSPSDFERADERYSSYFPRVFAYVHSCVGAEMPAQDIVVQAFCEAFSCAGNAGEHEFRTVLFRTARRLCQPALKDPAAHDEDSLTARERDVVSLIFDAGLTRDEIVRLFRIRESTVSSLLMAGLRKLKAQTSPAAAAAYLKLA